MTGGSVLHELAHQSGAADHHDTGQDNHGAVAQAEGKPDTHGVFALCYEFSRGIVDRGDVVPVVTVLDPGHIGRQHEAQRERLPATGTSDEQEDDGGKVQEDDRAEHKSKSRFHREMLTPAVHRSELGE